MKSQIRYNKPISFALLQTFLALNEGDEIDYEYFNEMTGFKEVTYKRVINLIDELTQDLHLKTGLVKTKEKVVTNKTEYLKAKYSFSTTGSWSFKLPEDLEEKTLFNSAVLLHDYTKQWSQTVIPTQQLNDAVIDLEAECMPFLRTALLNATGTKGIRVPDTDSANEVFEANSQLIEGALAAQPNVPIVGAIEFQELTDGNIGKSQEFLQSMQAIDNFRLGLHGVDNGGLFEKKSYVNQAQTGMNYAGGDVGLTLQDGLSIRQAFCNIVNSI